MVGLSSHGEQLMAKKCCPRIRVVCKKVGAETLSQKFWTLKGPLSKPVERSATARLHARTKCAVALGKRTVSEYVPLDSPRLDKAIARYQKSVSAQGCSNTDVTYGKVTPDKDPTYSKNASGLVLDKLKAAVSARRRK